MELIIFLIYIILDFLKNLNEDIIFWIVIFGIIIVVIIDKLINSFTRNNKKRKNFKFNEYNDWHKIEHCDIESKQLENELKVTHKKIFAKENEIIENVPIFKIVEEDNLFNVELFKKWCKNIFLCLQLGDSKDLKLIKQSVDESLIERKIEVLLDFENDNIELKREKLLVQEIKILDYAKWCGKSEIKVYIKATLKEYIIHKETQKILRGSKLVTEKNVIMTFQKKENYEQEGFINNCQSCGATIADTEFGRCQYCNSLVNPIRYNWKLIKYEVL